MSDNLEDLLSNTLILSLCIYLVVLVHLEVQVVLFVQPVLEDLSDPEVLVVRLALVEL